MKAKVTATFIAIYGVAAALVFASSAGVFQHIPGFTATPIPTSTKTPEPTATTTPWQPFEPTARKLEFHTLTDSPSSTKTPKSTPTSTATATATPTGTLGGGMIRQPTATTTN